MSSLINKPKSVVKDQKYEKYWQLTLSQTKFDSPQFVRCLKLVIDHIDKYNLANRSIDELVNDVNSNKKRLNRDVVHNDILANKIRFVFNNDDPTGATTRKQLNTLIKLGFINPFYRGYAERAKEYIATEDPKKRKRIFSDIVYSHATFNSSQTTDDSNNNQVSFLINTLLNKDDKKLSKDEIIGLMNMDTHDKKYASKKEIDQNIAYSSTINFRKRKYNQISFLSNILKKMNFISFNQNPLEFFLTTDADIFLENQGPTKRDPYRFGVMKKAVYEESIRIYNKKVSWFSKKEASAYVVSHIRDSADALKNWDYDTAYNPNNAILLAIGDEDMYFDKKKMTFNPEGLPIFGKEVLPEFIDDSHKNNYSLDNEIYNEQRKEFMKWHNEKFNARNN